MKIASYSYRRLTGFTMRAFFSYFILLKCLLFTAFFTLDPYLSYGEEKKEFTSNKEEKKELTYDEIQKQLEEEMEKNLPKDQKNLPPQWNREFVKKVLKNTVKRFGRDTLLFYLAGNVLEAVKYSTPPLRHLSNPGYVSSQWDQLFTVEGNLHFFTFIGINALLSEIYSKNPLVLRNQLMLAQMLGNKRQAFKLQYGAMGQGYVFMAIAALGGELATLGYEGISNCSLSHLWVSAYDSVKRRRSGVQVLIPSQREERSMHCKNFKKHFGKTITNVVYSSVPTLISAAMLSSTAQGLFVTSMRVASHKIAKKLPLKRSFKPLKSFMRFFRVSNDSPKLQNIAKYFNNFKTMMKLGLHFTIFLAAMEIMQDVMGDPLSSQLESWYYDRAKQKLKESSYEEKPQAIKEFSEASGTWVDHITAMLYIRRAEWEKDLVWSMDRAQFTKNAYKEIIIKIREDRLRESEVRYQDMDMVPKKMVDFPLELLRVDRGEIGNSCSVRETSEGSTDLSFEMTIQEAKKLFPIATRMKEQFFEKKVGISCVNKEPFSKIRIDISYPHIYETECRIKIARKYLKANECRWRNKQTPFKTHQKNLFIRTFPESRKLPQKQLVKIKEIESLEKYLSSESKEDWLLAFETLEKIQNREALFQACQKEDFFSEHCLFYELYEILDYPIVQSRMKFSFQKIDESIFQKFLVTSNGFGQSFSTYFTSHPAEQTLQYMHDDYYRKMKDWHPIDKSKDSFELLSDLSENLDGSGLFKLTGIESMRDSIKGFNMDQFETDFFSEKAFFSMLCGVKPKDSLMDTTSIRKEFLPPKIVEGGKLFCEGLKRSIISMKLNHKKYDFNELSQKLLYEGLDRLKPFVAKLESGFIESCDFINPDPGHFGNTNDYVEKRFNCWWQKHVSEVAFRPFFETHFDDYQNFLNEMVIPHLFGQSKDNLSLFEYENKDERQIPFEDHTLSRYKKTTAALSYMVEIDAYMEYVLKPLYKKINEKEDGDQCFMEFERNINSSIRDFVFYVEKGYSQQEDYSHFSSDSFQGGVIFKNYVCSFVEKREHLPSHFESKDYILWITLSNINKGFQNYFSSSSPKDEGEANCRISQNLEEKDEKLVRLVLDRISHTILQTFSDYSSYLSFDSFRSFNSFIRTHYCKEVK